MLATIVCCALFLPAGARPGIQQLFADLDSRLGDLDYMSQPTKQHLERKPTLRDAVMSAANMQSWPATNDDEHIWAKEGDTLPTAKGSDQETEAKADAGQEEIDNQEQQPQTKGDQTKQPQTKASKQKAKGAQLEVGGERKWKKVPRAQRRKARDVQLEAGGESQPFKAPKDWEWEDFSGSEQQDWPKWNPDNVEPFDPDDIAWDADFWLTTPFDGWKTSVSAEGVDDCGFDLASKSCFTWKDKQMAAKAKHAVQEKVQHEIKLKGSVEKWITDMPQCSTQKPFHILEKEDDDSVGANAAVRAGVGNAHVGLGGDASAQAEAGFGNGNYGIDVAAKAGGQVKLGKAKIGLHVSAGISAGFKDKGGEKELNLVVGGVKWGKKTGFGISILGISFCWGGEEDISGAGASAGAYAGDHVAKAQADTHKGVGALARS